MPQIWAYFGTAVVTQLSPRFARNTQVPGLAWGYRSANMARTDLPSFLLCSAVTGCVVLFFAFTVVKELNFYLFSRGLIQARSKIAIHYFDVVEYMGSPPAGSVRGGEWGAEVRYGPRLLCWLKRRVKLKPTYSKRGNLP